MTALGLYWEPTMSAPVESVSLVLRSRPVALPATDAWFRRQLAALTHVSDA